MGLFSFLRGHDINAGVAEYQATDGAVLLDVRTTDEYRQGHIEGSVNLPLDQIAAIGNIVKNKRRISPPAETWSIIYTPTSR